jgi:hypothetical protein
MDAANRSFQILSGRCRQPVPAESFRALVIVTTGSDWNVSGWVVAEEGWQRQHLHYSAVTAPQSDADIEIHAEVEPTGLKLHNVPTTVGIRALGEY